VVRKGGRATAFVRNGGSATAFRVKSETAEDAEGADERRARFRATIDIREEPPHLPPDIREEHVPSPPVAKYYRLAAAGRRAPGQEPASWRHFVGAVELVLRTT
jgi:hypothetical protein